jgi:hypothetical protein
MGMPLLKGSSTGSLVAKRMDSPSQWELFYVDLRGVENMKCSLGISRTFYFLPGNNANEGIREIR